MLKTTALLLVICLVSGLHAKNGESANFDVQQLEEIEDQTSQDSASVEIIEGNEENIWESSEGESNEDSLQERSDDEVVDDLVEGSGGQKDELEGSGGQGDELEGSGGRDNEFEGSGGHDDEFEGSGGSGEIKDPEDNGDRDPEDNGDRDPEDNGNNFPEYNGDKDPEDNGNKDPNNNPPFLNEKRTVDVDLILRIPILGKILHRRHSFVPLVIPHDN